MAALEVEKTPELGLALRKVPFAGLTRV